MKVSKVQRKGAWSGCSPYPCWIPCDPNFRKGDQLRSTTCCFFDQATCLVYSGFEIEPYWFVLRYCDFDYVGHFVSILMYLEK